MLKYTAEAQRIADWHQSLSVSRLSDIIAAAYIMGKDGITLNKDILQMMISSSENE